MKITSVDVGCVAASGRERRVVTVRAKIGILAQTIRRSACERFWKRHQDWSSSTDCPGTASFNHLVGAGDQLVWNGFSVPIGSLNRLLLWGMFLATLPNSLLRYGCEIFATLRIFLNRVTIQDRFSAEVLSKQ
jgi:hypothetical protein